MNMMVSLSVKNKLKFKNWEDFFNMCEKIVTLLGMWKAGFKAFAALFWRCIKVVIEWVGERGAGKRRSRCAGEWVSGGAVIGWSGEVVNG